MLILFKGTGSILFLKKWLEKKIAEKNYKNYLKVNNYEVCKAVVRCILNILDVMVLENIKRPLNQNMATIMVV